MAWGYGLKTDVVEGRGIVLRDIDEGEHLLVKGVDFGKGARKFTASVEGPAAIEVRLDAVDGPLVGTLTVKAGKPGFREASCALKGAAGVHDLYFVFKSGLKGAAGVHDLYFVFKSGGFRWDWWKMTR